MNTNQIDKFYYGVSVSSPCLCPIECLYSKFLWKGGCVHVSGVTIVCNGVGCGYNGIIRNSEPEQKLPEGISTAWLNFTERKIYELQEFLPHDQIVDLFNMSVGLDEELGSNGNYKFDTFDLCYLPDGKVVLYVKSSYLTLLTDWSAKGEESHEYDEHILLSKGCDSMSEYFDLCIEDEPGSTAVQFEKDKGPVKSIIKQYFTRYNYRLSFDFENQDSKLGNSRLYFTNGEWIKASFEKVFDIIKVPSILKNFNLSWDNNGSRYFCYMYFNEAEMFRIFDEAYAYDCNQQGVLLIKVCKYNNLFEISLNVGDKSFLFEKTEIRVFVKQLDLLDQNPKLVYVNYEKQQNFFIDEL